MGAHVDYRVLDVAPTPEMIKLAEQIRELQSKYLALEKAQQRRQLRDYVVATRGRAIDRYLPRTP